MPATDEALCSSLLAEAARIWEQRKQEQRAFYRSILKPRKLELDGVRELILLVNPLPK